jgi:hypothetical protein
MFQISGLMRHSHVKDGTPEPGWGVKMAIMCAEQRVAPCQAHLVGHLARMGLADDESEIGCSGNLFLA